MNQFINQDRRRFLKFTPGICAAGLLCTPGLKSAFAVVNQEPLSRSGEANIQLGLAAYSFRKHFEFMKGKPQKPQDGKKLTMFDFIDYCAQQKCAAELTSYFFPPDADQAYFLKIKRHAFLQGVPLAGTAIGNNFTIGKGARLDREIQNAKKWIDNAVTMGAPHIRFFAGTRKQLESSPDNMKIAIESLQHCVDYAATKGLFMGVENHGQLTADQVIEIIKGVNSDWFGVNLDTGNFISDDPYVDIEKCVPFAVNIQLKVKIKKLNGTTEETNLDRLKKIFTQANYRGNVVLEFEESKPFEEIPGYLAKLRKTFG